MTELYSIVPENFKIRPEILQILHKFMADNRIGSHEVVLGTSVIVAGMADLDEDKRIAWLKMVADQGWVDPQVVNQARKVMQEKIAELAAAQADDAQS